MKQVIVMRKDLGMRAGKMCSQAAHASMKAFVDYCIKFSDAGDIWGIPREGYLYYKDSYMDKWLSDIFTKITCRVDSEDELLEIYKKVQYGNANNPYADRLPLSLITDCGLTEFHNVPTNTCIAVGPGPVELVDKFTKHLKLL